MSGEVATWEWDTVIEHVCSECGKGIRHMSLRQVEASINEQEEHGKARPAGGKDMHNHPALRGPPRSAPTQSGMDQCWCPYCAVPYCGARAVRTWRSISKSMAFCMLEKEFMFLISTRVPKVGEPRGRTLTLTSTLRVRGCEGEGTTGVRAVRA